MATLKIDTNRIREELMDWLNCNPSDVAVSTCGHGRNKWAIAIKHNGRDMEYTLRIRIDTLAIGRKYVVQVDEEDWHPYPVYTCTAMLAGYQGISDDVVIWSSVCAALKATADWARR